MTLDSKIREGLTEKDSLEKDSLRIYRGEGTNRATWGKSTPDRGTGWLVGQPARLVKGTESSRGRSGVVWSGRSR